MILHARELLLRRNWRSNQHFHVGYGLELEENDAKTQGKVFADYFSSIFFARFLLYRSLKKGVN
jgi:hypothetical protein